MSDESKKPPQLYDFNGHPITPVPEGVDPASIYVWVDEASKVDSSLWDKVSPPIFVGLDVAKSGDTSVLSTFLTPPSSSPPLTLEVLNKTLKQLENSFQGANEAAKDFANEFNFYDLDENGKPIPGFEGPASNTTYVGSDIMNMYTWVCLKCSKPATILGFFLNEINFETNHQKATSWSGQSIMVAGRAEYRGKVDIFPSCTGCADIVIPVQSIRALLTKELKRQLESKITVEVEQPRAINLDL